MADERKAALDAALKRIEKTLEKAPSCEWVTNQILKLQLFHPVHWH